MTTTQHFGYWIFGKDMNNVNLNALRRNGVTDVFLNFYAFTVHGRTKVLNWIKKANSVNINVHIWVQCFYDGEWHNPATTNLTSKLKEINTYAKMSGVKGVHLDYLRYPGTAYKTKGGTAAVTNFVKKVRSQNPKTFLTCAIMPENEGKYYYGQDLDALGSIVDAVLPMQYKGNYKTNTKWLASTTKTFSKKATIWSGLQAYKSDDNPKALSGSELLTDTKTCLNSGAKGVILFRYGLSPDINFTTLSKKTSDKMKVSANDIKNIANTVTNYVTKNRTFPATFTVNNVKYSYGQVAYILSHAVINPGKSVSIFAVKNAPKVSGNGVKEYLAKDDYQDVAKRLNTFIKTNKTCPNYATTKKSKKKMRPRIFIFMLARVVAYYYSHNKTFPKRAAINSNYFKSATAKKTTTKKTTNTTKKASNKLNSYLTTKGCRGMGQCTGYYCACNSLQQCFYRLTGILVSEATIASVAGTTTAGTDHYGINTAVSWFNKKYKQNIKITWKNFSDLGSSDTVRWQKLQSYINKGAVFIHLLYRNQWGHYEVPKGVGSSSLSILNSLGDGCGSGTYCGYIETRSKSAQKSYINGISQKSVAILTKG